MTKSIAILGSGWLGAPLAQHLLSLGFNLKLSTRSQLRKAELSKKKIDIHIVDIDETQADYRKFLKTNILIINITSKDIDAFSRLIKQIEASNIDKLIFISSTSVYSDNDATIFESDNLESKDKPLFIIENLFRQSHHFKTTILRFGGLIGYQRHPGNFFSPNKPLKNPHAKVNLIHRDDCLQIIHRIIEKNCWGEIFNCCANSHPSKAEFYSHAAKQLGKQKPILDESGPHSYKVISSQKLKNSLGYQFIHADLMSIDFSTQDQYSANDS